MRRKPLTEQEVAFAIDTIRESFAYLQTDIPKALQLHISRATEKGVGGETDPQTGDIQLFFRSGPQPAKGLAISRAAILTSLSGHEALHSVRVIRGLDSRPCSWSSIVVAEGLASHFQGKTEAKHGFVAEGELPMLIEPVPPQYVDEFINVVNTGGHRLLSNVVAHGVNKVGYHVVRRALGDHVSSEPQDYLHRNADFLKLITDSTHEATA